MVLLNLNFTFHNVSISTLIVVKRILHCFPLHSTMYLFLRVPLKTVHFLLIPLHSTMYLFLPYLQHPDSVQVLVFTFHNVSISTHSKSYVVAYCCLYIPQCIYFYSGCAASLNSSIFFTFHNVSIST